LLVSVFVYCHNEHNV